MTFPDFSINIGSGQPYLKAIELLTRVTLSEFMDLTEDQEIRIQKIIVEDDYQGLGIARMVKDISEQVESIDSTQAEILSRTAIHLAYNRAAWEDWVKRAPFKMWIATPNNAHTRPSHKALHHIIIPADEPFDVPAFTLTDHLIPACKMQYPGDMTYKPDLGQVLCCRCTIGPKFIEGFSSGIPSIFR